MAISVGKWKEEWLRMKNQFEAESGKKKPSKTFLGVRKKSGVASAFGKMDDSYNAMRDAKPEAKQSKLKDFVKAVDAAEKEGDKYVAELSKAAAKEPQGSDIQALLKIMKKDIKACVSQARGQAVMFQESLKSDGNLDPKKMRGAKVLKSSLAGTLKKASLWIAQQARNPDAASFNAEINRISRDVTQNLKNLQKLYQNSDEASEIRKCVVPLEAWADKGRQVNGSADAGAVTKELKLFQTSIKRTAAWLKQAGDPA